MNEEKEKFDDSITSNELVFLASLCSAALKALGHIKASLFRPFHIAFGYDCEEKGLLVGTMPIDGGYGIQIKPRIPKESLLATIAHESVHLIHYMKGDAHASSAGFRLFLSSVRNV